MSVAVPGVSKYQVGGKAYWKVDTWLTQPDGQPVRFRKRKIPTREQAEALVAKAKAEAFEGRYFEKAKTPTLTVGEAWEAYKPISKRDNDSWQTDQGRARHLLRHLGNTQAMKLTVATVDEYRNKRLAEVTHRGQAPAPATLDREVALLKRMLAYAVSCGTLPKNPVASVRLLRKPNVRRTVLAEAAFARLLEAAEPSLRPILLTAYDTGMRKGEILNLKWPQVDLKHAVIKLAPQDTKTEQHRTIHLTKRVLKALSSLPRGLRIEHVFFNPKTGKPWNNVRKMFRRACEQAGVQDAWFHDLRRSFVTNARRRGVAESVVMRMSGHRTRAVFDRYNVVADEDVAAAVGQIEEGAAQERKAAGLGQDLDKVEKRGR